jgi:flavin reductase (NADH)
MTVPYPPILVAMEAEEVEEVDDQDFRAIMRAFPAPVVVVTALDADGLPRGLTCSAVCSVSTSPPALLICVSLSNGSLDAIRESRGFVVNLLHEGRREVSDVFASASPEKFTGVAWEPSAPSGLPLLVDDAVAFVDCALQCEIVAGTHAIIIGKVRASGTGATGPGPLVYHNRTYGRWAPAAVPDHYVPDHRVPDHRTKENGMSDEEVPERLSRYIRDRFLDGDPNSELEETTPLLEWGILTSMNTALLLTWIRDDFGVEVPIDRLTGQNFKDIGAISAMVTDLLARSSA